MATLLFILLISACTIAQQYWEKPCYLINGSVSKEDVLCSSDSAVCCPPGRACMSSGLCSSNGLWPFWRAACAARDWSDPTCPQLCEDDGAASAHEYPLLCDSQNISSWCCNDYTIPRGNCCASADAKMFSFMSGMRTAVAPAMGQSWSSFIATYTPRSGDKWDTSKSGTRTTSSIGSQNVPSTSSSATSIPLSGSQPTSSASTSASSAGAAKDRRPTTILGVAIGVPLGLLSIAGLSYLFLRQHRKIKALKKQSSDADALPSEDSKPPHNTAELDAQSSALVELGGGTMPTDNKPSEKTHSDALLCPPAELGRSALRSELDGSVIGAQRAPANSSISEMQGSAVPTPVSHQVMASSTNLQVANASQQRYSLARSASSHQSSENDISRSVSFELPANGEEEEMHPGFVN